MWTPTDLFTNKDRVNTYCVLGSTLGVEDTTMKKMQSFTQELLVQWEKPDMKQKIQRASAKNDESRMLGERTDWDEGVSRSECLAEQEACELKPALFTKAKTQKQPKCPSTEDGQRGGTYT